MPTLTPLSIPIPIFTHLSIGGSRGRARCTPPSPPPPPPTSRILSFLYTFSPKSTCIEGRHPPLPNGLMPPTGNPESATDKNHFWLIWFINQRAFYNHCVCHRHHWHHPCCLFTSPPGAGLDIETLYLPYICKYVPQICTSNIE